MVMLGQAQELYDIDDIEYREVEVPEWKIGGEVVTVRLKSLTGIDRDRFEASMATMNRRTGQPEPNIENIRARLVALSAVDASGVQIFKGEASVLNLGMKNAKGLDRLFDAAAELSGLSLAGIKEQAENFDGDPSESSTTG